MPMFRDDDIVPKLKADHVFGMHGGVIYEYGDSAPKIVQQGNKYGLEYPSAVDMPKTSSTQETIVNTVLDYVSLLSKIRNQEEILAELNALRDSLESKIMSDPTGRYIINELNSINNKIGKSM